MFGRSNKPRDLWLAGFLFLLAATALHAFEHWEISTHSECISHSSDSKNSALPDHDSTHTGGHHDHGCGSHDHSAAVMDALSSLQIHPSIQTLSLSIVTATPAPGEEIEIPPRLI